MTNIPQPTPTDWAFIDRYIVEAGSGAFDKGDRAYAWECIRRNVIGSAAQLGFTVQGMITAAHEWPHMADVWFARLRYYAPYTADAPLSDESAEYWLALGVLRVIRIDALRLQADMAATAVVVV